jgi:hypothetical protein
MGSAVSRMRFTTAWLLDPKLVAQTRPASPLTCGVDIDVPILYTYPPEKLVERIPFPEPSRPPGAATWTQLPNVENEDIESFESTLATAITWLQLAGVWSADVLSFPAATTMTTFRAHA